MLSFSADRLGAEVRFSICLVDKLSKVRQHTLAHPLTKKALLGRIKGNAYYSRWSGYARTSCRLPLGNNSSRYSWLTRMLSRAYARKASFLERYTISDSGTTVYPTNVEGLAPFYPERCRGAGYNCSGRKAASHSRHRRSIFLMRPYAAKYGRCPFLLSSTPLQYCQLAVLARAPLANRLVFRTSGLRRTVIKQHFSHGLVYTMRRRLDFHLRTCH
jgi:hypothetical protein